MLRCWTMTIGVMLGSMALVLGSGCQSAGGGGTGSPNDNNENDNTIANDNGPDGGGADNGNTVEECTTLTYANFAQDFFENYCIQCHSTEVSGGDRFGAPGSVNFNTFDGVLERLDRVRDRVTVDETMPNPRGDAFPTDEERTMLQEWIDCDAPE